MTRIREITIEHSPIGDDQAHNVGTVIDLMITVMTEVLATSMPAGQHPSISTVLSAMMQGTADRLSGLDKAAAGRMCCAIGQHLTGGIDDPETFVAAMKAEQLALARAELTLRARLQAGGSA